MMSQIQSDISPDIADKFVRLALANVVREYPNQILHALNGPGDARGPRELHPIFYGCFDWHSCVHGYWLLARLYRTDLELRLKKEIEQQFDLAFTKENVADELRYLQRPSSRAFERPYGWAWLLMLCHELSLHENERGRRWHGQLMPIADLIADRFEEYLPKADYPFRAGIHGNSAFALILSCEFAKSHGRDALRSLLESKARQWYQQDAGCQVWEPSHAEFHSPALIEALCMLRLLPLNEFRDWFARFLPELRDRKLAVLFEPARVSDRSDGHISHLDGLNLSRAWCFRSIAEALQADEDLAELLRSASASHLKASMPHIFGDYAGEHWLATYALLAISDI